MTTNNEAIEIQSPEKSIREMQIIDDANLAEQENMDTLNSEHAQTIVVEEGELPEEGEIMDDEEEEAPSSDAVAGASEIPQEPLLEVPSTESQSTSQSSTTTTTPATPATTAPPATVTTTQENSPVAKEDETNSKKRGPSSPDDPYVAKKQALSPDVPHLQPRRRAAWTEAVLCKFFREGYCRDGENCAYSHNAAHSNRKPELCKFYQQGFCKKGLACTLLHGEYPCKAFHEGKCDRIPCKYSHNPLNDYTRAIFEQMVQDEALASKIIIPQQPARRRVLLPRPAPNAYPVQSFKLSPKYEEPMTVLANSVHDFDKNAENDIKLVNEPQPFVAMTAAQDPDEQMVSNEKAAPLISPKQEIVDDTPKAPQNATPLSISEMLDQLTECPMNTGLATNAANLNDMMKSTIKSEPIDFNDTPQSPPKVVKERIYRLIPLIEFAPDYDLPFFKKITSDKYKGDPRVQSVVQKQFDRASSMFGQNMPGPTVSSQPKASLLGDKPHLSRDPRIRAAALDPRQRPLPVGVGLPTLPPPLPVVPSARQIPINGAPPPFPSGAAPVQPVAANLDDPHFKSLIQKQLQMVNDINLHEPRPQTSIKAEPMYEEPPRERFREEEYGERRDYDNSYPERGYNAPYNNYEERPSRFDEPSPYQPYGDVNYRGASRYGPPISSRGRGSRGYHDVDRYPPPPPRRHVERFESRWEADPYRREPYREQRDRREYGRPGANRYRERSRSRSPRRVEPPIEDRPLTMREKRKNNEYQSPLARA